MLFSSLSLFVALASLVQQVDGKTYTSGSTTVDVTIEYVDENNSTHKCVEYVSGGPGDYQKACFATILNANGVFIDCEVAFDDGESGMVECNSCMRCETNDDEIGYQLDCYNIQPTENTQSCTPFNDLAIQQILVDTQFDATPFAFTDNATTTAENGDHEGDDNTRSGATVFMSVAMVVSAALLGLLTLLAVEL
jgi:hypothetical protein